MLGLRLSTLSNTKRQALKALIKGKDLKVTRAALGLNPLTLYNNTSANMPTTFANNGLITHGDYAFVNGDTWELSYDMATKTAGDSTTCPVKIYTRNYPTLLSPTDPLWNEITNQAEIDRVKDGVNNNSTSSQSATNTYIAQMMLEIDMTADVNAISSGSNSAFKSLMKSLSIDLFAGGNGASGAGCHFQIYANNIPTWWDDGGTSCKNSSNSISKLSLSFTGGSTGSYFLNNSNKIYIIVYANSASDGVTPSSVSLDSFSVKVQLTATPSVVQPQSVYLPKYWAMVIKGFSPNWDSEVTENKFIMNLGSDINNRYTLAYLTSKKFELWKQGNGASIGVSTSTIQSFSKFTSFNFVCGQNANGMFLYALKNNASSEKATNTDTKTLEGQRSLSPLNYYTSGYQCNAFFESFQLYDLDALGKSTGLTDAEADAILRGTQPNIIGVSMKELFDINQVSLHANAVRSGNTITLNATASGQVSLIDIPVIPNNKYQLNATVVGNGTFQTAERNNAIWVKQTTTINTSFVTSPNTNNIELRMYANAAGTMTFSNISLKMLM